MYSQLKTWEVICDSCGHKQLCGGQSIDEGLQRLNLITVPGQWKLSTVRVDENKTPYTPFANVVTCSDMCLKDYERDKCPK